MQSKVKADAATLRIAALATAVLLFLLTASTASAATITVDDSGGAMYTSIQAAVDAASEGDTIIVRNGTYPENIRINNKDLTLEGEDRNVTIIDGSGSGNCFGVSSADVNISGFTIKNAGNYGVYAYSSDLNINNATIRHCRDDAIYFKDGKSLTLRDSILENCSGGLYYYSAANGNATIERNIIRDNTGSSLRIHLTSGKNAVINDNMIINSTGTGSDGINCWIDNGVVSMENNTVKNSGRFGIYLSGAENVALTNTTIDTAGDDGLYVYNCQNMTINPSFTIQNVSGYGIYTSEHALNINNATISNCGDDAIYFKDGKSLLLKDSVIENCGCGINYDGRAIGNATIERNIIRDNTGSGLRILLISEKNAVINDNMIINSTGTGSEGIFCSILSNGEVTMENNTVKNSRDDGIYLSGAENVTLTNITIDTAGDDGLYVYNCQNMTINPPFTIQNVSGYGIYTSEHTLNINNATISNCGDDAIYFKDGKSLLFKDSVIENCGCGINYDGRAIGNATIERNIIRDNTGSGLRILLTSGKNAVINDNMIINSTGTGSNGIFCSILSNGGVTMENNTVKNSRNDGIYLSGAENVIITDTTINTTGGYGIYTPGCDLSITNATIGHCGDDAIYFKDSKSLLLKDSIIENCGGGINYDGHAIGNATIEGNVIRDNTGSGLRILLTSGKNAVINDNMIINNSGYGISLYSSSSNLIFHNNLVNNSPNAYDSNSASNDWHHPILLEGNYWSDYTGVDDGSGTGKHAIAGDGIGDTNIPHPGANYDHYPFVNVSRWLIQHDIAVISIDAPVFVEVNSTILINSTIWNFGLNNESNITIDFIVGGVSQSNTNIPFLTSRSYTNVSFHWTAPGVAGMHNITIYVEPVVNETIVWNNKLSKIITIGDIWVPDTYPTIQQAVNNAAAGDMIIVRDGTYTDNVDVNKRLTIRSENESVLTIVQAASSSDHVFEVTADYVNISGFTVTGTDKAGIYLYNVDRCNISDNNASNNGYGIYLNFSSNCTLTNNSANSNSGIGSYKKDGYGYGIYLNFSSNCTLTNNAANSNSGTGFYNYDGYGLGIYLVYSNNCTLTSNTANSNSGIGGYGHDPYESFGGVGEGYGIFLYSSSNCMLTNNTANSNNGIGGRGENADDWNEWVGGPGGDGYCNGIFLNSSSNCMLTNNTANSNMGSGGNGGRGQYGGIGGKGGDGYSSGIFLYSSSNCTVTNNTAYSSNGRGGNGGIGIHDADGGDGGDGYGDGIYLSSSSNCTLISNTANSNYGSGGRGGRGGVGSGASDGSNGYGYGDGFFLYSSGSNLIYNNYFTNTNNAYDDGSNIWNITKTSGTNIIGGPYLGGNYWSDYTGWDTNGDGLGDIKLPYNSSGNIITGGDYLPLIQILIVQFEIKLESGWNLISLPLMPEDTSITSLLSTINDNYSIVWAYNASDTSDHWKKYDPATPFGNDLITMEPGKGYWIMMTSDDTLNISGTMPTPIDIELWSGWNLIGYNSLNPQTITDALSSINGNYSIIWAYNASDSTDHWNKYDPNTPFGNDLENMEPGKGYWIMMSTDDILEI